MDEGMRVCVEGKVSDSAGHVGWENSQLALRRCSCVCGEEGFSEC